MDVIRGYKSGGDKRLQEWRGLVVTRVDGFTGCKSGGDERL